MPLLKSSKPWPENDAYAYLNECPLHLLALEQLEAIDIRVSIGENLEVEAPQIFAKLIDLQKRADLLGGTTTGAKEKISALTSRLSGIVPN